MAKQRDDRVTKRRVTCRSVSLLPNGDTATREIVDYVRPNFDGEPEDTTGFLDAYVADAQTRWQYVEVSDEPDAGPGGYEGDTVVPAHLQGRDPGEFAAYGDASTPRNALDEHLGITPAPPGGGRGGAAGAVGGFAAGLIAHLGFMLHFMLTVAAVVMTFRLSLIQTATQKNNVATAYGAAATHAALYSTVPGASAGTELAGGAPAYARIPTAWGAPTNGVISTGPHTFNVASGSTVAGAGFHTALTAGTYLDGGSLTSQAFASQGTYALTASYTQT